jgi:hypothetical protein
MRMLTLLAVTYTANNTSPTAAGHSFQLCPLVVVPLIIVNLYSTFLGFLPL